MLKPNPYGIHRLRKAVVKFIGGQFLQAVGYAGLLLILVRLLPIADYGVYMLLIGLSEMLLLVASFGILSAGKRYLPLLITALPAARLFSFVFALIAMQTAVLCLVAVVLWWYWPAAGDIMGFTAEQIRVSRPAILLFFLIPAFRFICEFLDSLLEQGKSRFVSALMINGRLAGIALFMALGLQVNLSIILQLDIAITAVSLLLAYGLLYRSLVSLHSADATGTLQIREIARFAWHMVPVDLMGAAASAGAMRLVLANALGVAESGLFAFLQSLQRLAGRYLLPGTLLRGVVMPVLIARAASAAGMSVITHGAGLLIKSNLLVTVAGIVIIGISGDRIVELLSGGKFHNAGVTLLLMFVALVISAQGIVLGMVMQIIGRTSILRATAAIAPAALLIVWMAADQGLNAVILITIAGAALSNGIVMSILVRTAGFGMDWRGQFMIYGAAAAAITLGLLLKLANVHLVFATAGALAAFSALLTLLRPFGGEEFSIVEKIVGRRTALLTFGPITKRAA